MARVFLGWDGPVLPRATAWLAKRYAAGDRLDLGRVLAVTPAGRAGRRLLELLAERAEADGLLLTPPTLATVGELPETLYDAPDGLVDDLSALLVRGHVLWTADRALVERVTRRRPAEDDAAGWLELAGELADLAEELAGARKTPADVAALGHDRWDAIARLQADYEQAMRGREAVDRTMARFDALAQGVSHHDGDIVLIGAADLLPLTVAMLAPVAEQVTALIAAPEAEAGAFGPWGEIQVEAWAERSLDLAADRLVMVDRPRDQARAVVEQIAARRDADAGPEDVVVGLGDEALGPVVQRTLDLAGAPTRLASGTPMPRSRPALLLDAAARFVRSRRWDDFAALLRHPDAPPGGRSAAAGRASWLELLDRYASEHVQPRVTGTWLGERAEPLKAIWDAVHGWLPSDAAQRKPLPEWAEPIAAMLRAVYGGRSLRRDDADQAALLHALTTLADELGRLADLDPADAATPRVTADQAIGVLLQRTARATIPPIGGDPAIELLGFLELPLDDAPVAVVTGVNEGAIPASTTAHPLLPDSLRRQLGLPDNHRRYARDLYAMTVVLHSRPEAVVVAGRRSAEGDPLAPSRLLLACDHDTLAQRVTAFYEPPASPPSAPLLAPGVVAGPSRFTVAPPVASEALTSLRVTAFRDYLASPYRFYLKHVLKLEGLEDVAVEMSGALFGNVAHDVLRDFGQTQLVNQPDAEAMAAYLDQRLDADVARRFGRSPAPAVVLQVEQLRARFEALARQQAGWVRDGWRVLPEHIEQAHEAQLVVDGEPFTITGRIDRIDLHPELGYRVVDYKTRDAAEAPDKAHQHGGAWTDLQLPLYRELVSASGITGSVDLGYVQLPRDLGQVGFVSAAWKPAEIDDAVETAREVIRGIRAGDFGTVGDVPRFDDGLSGPCYDRVADRSAVLTPLGGGA